MLSWQTRTSGRSPANVQGSMAIRSFRDGPGDTSSGAARTERVASESDSEDADLCHNRPWL